MACRARQRCRREQPQPWSPPVPVPLPLPPLQAPFGNPDYDETERFDLRVSGRRAGRWPAFGLPACVGLLRSPTAHVRLGFAPPPSLCQLPFVDNGDPDPELANDPLGERTLFTAPVLSVCFHLLMCACLPASLALTTTPFPSLPLPACLPAGLKQLGKAFGWGKKKEDGGEQKGGSKKGRK